MTKTQKAELLMHSIHNRDLLIFKKIYVEDLYVQHSVHELREDDIVFFRHPETLGLLLGQSGTRFFKVKSLPFCKNGLVILDVEELSALNKLNTVREGDDECGHECEVLTTDTVIGKTYLRLV